MRPRLMLSLEQQIQKNIDNPDLRLRGAEGLSDARRQGAERRQGSDRLVVRARLGGARLSRRALRRRGARCCAPISRRCSTWISRRGAQKVSLNGPLVEQAQATLARMRVAERAYTLLKSEAHNDGDRGLDRVASTAARTWRWCSRRPTAPASTPCASRGFFTYDGFIDRASRPHADDRRQAAEGELGAWARRATRPPSSSSM